MSNTWSKNPNPHAAPGLYKLSLAPENRKLENGKSYPAVIRCDVHSDGSVKMHDTPGESYVWLYDSIFDGALWMQDIDPPDPFAENCEKFLDFGIE